MTPGELGLMRSPQTECLSESWQWNPALDLEEFNIDNPWQAL